MLKNNQLKPFFHLILVLSLIIITCLLRLQRCEISTEYPIYPEACITVMEYSENTKQKCTIGFGFNSNNERAENRNIFIYPHIQPKPKYIVNFFLGPGHGERLRSTLVLTELPTQIIFDSSNSNVKSNTKIYWNPGKKNAYYYQYYKHIYLYIIPVLYENGQGISYYQP